MEQKIPTSHVFRRVKFAWVKVPRRECTFIFILNLYLFRNCSIHLILLTRISISICPSLNLSLSLSLYLPLLSPSLSQYTRWRVLFCSQCLYNTGFASCNSCNYWKDTWKAYSLQMLNAEDMSCALLLGLHFSLPCCCGNQLPTGVTWQHPSSAGPGISHFLPWSLSLGI